MTGPENSRQSRLEDEIGDILFVIVNLARFLKIDSESALEASQPKIQNPLSIHGSATRESRQEP